MALHRLFKATRAGTDEKNTKPNSIDERILIRLFNGILSVTCQCLCSPLTPEQQNYGKTMLMHFELFFQGCRIELAHDDPLKVGYLAPAISCSPQTGRKRLARELCVSQVSSASIHQVS